MQNCITSNRFIMGFIWSKTRCFFWVLDKKGDAL